MYVYGFELESVQSIIREPNEKMSRWHLDSVMAKVKIVQRNLRLLTDRQPSIQKFTGLESYRVYGSNHSSFKQLAPFCMNLHSCAVSRNFSTTKAVWKYQRTNQDKEKMKNYLLFGGSILALLVVFYINLTMEYHQDYVTFEPEEKKK